MSSSVTAPINLKAVLRQGMRTGGPRTQPTHPGILTPLLRIPVMGAFAKATFYRAIAFILGARASGPHVFQCHRSN